jgi:arylsulfatase A-like enzyme
LFSRLAEVFAGFSEYTDVQVGRIIDYLEHSGQLDNTIVFQESVKRGPLDYVPRKVGTDG